MDQKQTARKLKCERKIKKEKYSQTFRNKDEDLTQNM